MRAPHNLAAKTALSLTLAAFVCICSAACGTGAAPEVSNEPGLGTGTPLPTVGNGAGTTPTPSSGAVPALTGPGLGLRVQNSYIARRKDALVAIPVDQVAAAAAAGDVVEFTRLSNATLAFGDRCLAVEGDFQVSGGALELVPCDASHALTLIATESTVPVTFSYVADNANAHMGWLIVPGVSSCPDASSANCRITYSVTKPEPTTLTASPLKLGQSPNGALVRSMLPTNVCLVANGATPAVATCDVNDANQRWSPRVTPKATDANARTFALVTTDGRCLLATGAVASARLSVGDCGTPGALPWALSNVLYVGLNGPQPFLLTADAATGSLHLRDVETLRTLHLQPANYLWQIGPDVAAP